MSELLAFEDPNHEGNSPSYHTGEPCHTKGCDKPAGTWWSPHWCFEHNVDRLRNITTALEDAVKRAEMHAMIDSATGTLRDWAYKNSRIIKAMVAASGGKITIQEADIERECVHESVHTPGDGTQTWRVTLK